MNAWEIKQLYPNICKLKNGKYWKDLQLQAALMVDVICAWKKRYKLCYTLILLTY